MIKFNLKLSHKHKELLNLHMPLPKSVEAILLQELVEDEKTLDKSRGEILDIKEYVHTFLVDEICHEFEITDISLPQGFYSKC